MIRVLIADDEELFREGLAMDVDWETCGLELVGLAANGHEALAMVSEFKPDIVVTDIRMPNIDGLEFIKKAKELSQDIQFIIVSGHEEFEYAQRAVKLGVCDFLLKPLDDEELQNLLIERKTLIMKNRKQKRDRSIRDTFLRLNSWNEKDDSLYHCIINIQNDDYSSFESTIKEFYLEIEKCIQLNQETAILESRNGTTVICLNGRQEKELKSNIDKFVTTIRRNNVLNQNYSYSIGVGSIKYGSEKLNSSYDEAKTALNQKYLEGNNRVFYFEKLKSSEPGKGLDMKDLDYSELLKAVIEGHKEKMDSCLLKLIQITGFMGKDSYAYGLMITGNVFTETLKILDESGSDSMEVLGNPMSVYEKITSRQTMEEMFQELRINLDVIQKHLTLKSSGGNEALFQKIRNWMNNQYRLPRINLQSAAEEFNISQGHLCSIFSNYSDDTFTEYLTTLRINKACELIMSSDYMVYEIAYKVGYSNPTYFNSVFKKKTGLSPGQYKKKNKQCR